jgi:indolepyruvate decarboxylase
MTSPKTPKKHTVGSFLFEYLHRLGVKTAFGLPGDFVLPTIRWLEESPIEFITLTHEPAVGYAADAYARINGLGVACVTYCVGGLNMVNSVACAYAEKSPVVVISGGPSPTERKKNPLLHHKVRNFDTQKKIYDEITCASTIILDPKDAVAEIRRVVGEVKRQCRPGYIEIPYDIVDMPVERPRYTPYEEDPSDPETLEACLAEAIAMIEQAKKPVILAGVELHRHKLTDLAVGIAKETSIPIAATLLSKSVIRETNPLYIGVYSGALSEPACQHYIDTSDCVIMLGTFITDVFLGLNTSELRRKNSILVTTEEARVGLHSYKDVRLDDFLKALSKAKLTPRTNFVNPNPARIPEPLASKDRGDTLSVEGFFNIVATHMGDGSTVVCDTGDALIGAIGLRTSSRKNFIADAYYLSMGFALPAGIGAIKAAPSSKVFVIAGDGAFQMTGMEISTLAKYKLNPIVIIINNDGYGTQRHIIDGPFNEITMWHYTKLTEVIGYGQSRKVHTKGELDDALKEAVKNDGFYLIEVVVPRNDCSRSLRRMGEELGKLRDKKKQE